MLRSPLAPSISKPSRPPVAPRWCAIIGLVATAACANGHAGLAGDAAVDAFGVPRLYPTAPGGREWLLGDATVAADEWRPETLDVTQVSAGVFHTEGESGQIRLNVPSPAGEAWWRDVEMTGYFRVTGPLATAGQRPHFELFARGERHSSRAVTGDRINYGVVAPVGTATWPGYPYGTAAVNPACLGTAYHGNVYPDAAEALFEKEVSHSAGYAAQRARVAVTTWPLPAATWFGVKLVVRNADGGTRVHLELWLDTDATGAFTKVSETDDLADAWPATTATINGCAAAPFGYTPGMLLTWAGPFVTFRSDGQAIDFRWLSVREVGPLP